MLWRGGNSRAQVDAHQLRRTCNPFASFPPLPSSHINQQRAKQREIASMPEPTQLDQPKLPNMYHGIDLTLVESIVTVLEQEWALNSPSAFRRLFAAEVLTRYYAALQLPTLPVLPAPSTLRVERDVA